MKKSLYLLVAVLSLLSCMLSPIYAETAEKSVKITLPDSRVSKTEIIEMEMELSRLDETVDYVTVFASGFEITDCRGNSSRNYLRIPASDLPGQAFGTSTHQETVKLQWKAGDSLTTGVVYVALENEEDNKITETEDGDYVLPEPVQDGYCFAMDEQYVAFGIDEETAAERLTASSSWIVMVAVVTVCAVVVTVVAFILLRQKGKRQSQIADNTVG